MNSQANAHEPLRVLHVLSGDLWGGAEAQMGLQIRAQRILGLDSRVLLFNPGEAQNRYLEFGIPLEVIPEKFGLVKLIRGALRNVREFVPEIIVSHGYKETFVACYVSLLTKTPFISTIHGRTESYSGFRAFKSYVYSSISLLLAQYFAKTTIVPTQDLRRQIKLQSEVVCNVADLTPLTEELTELRSGIGLDISQPLMVWVGRIVSVKRLDRAIQAILILKSEGINVNLAVVGTGELEEASRQLVKSLGLETQIKFLGFRSDTRALIGAADILLLTSQSEGLPTVMAEAMTQGTKLVMSDLAGIREIAEKFKGYPIELISPTTPEAFARGIKESLNKLAPISTEMMAEVRDWFDPLRAAKEAELIYRNI